MIIQAFLNKSIILEKRKACLIMKKYVISKLSIIAFVGLSMLNLGCSSEGNRQDSLDWKTGVGLYSFNKFPFTKTLDMTDSIGAKYVEGFFFHNLGPDFGDEKIPNLSDESIAKMKALIADRKLTMPSLYAGGAKNIAEWEAFFVFAQKMGIQFLVAEPEQEYWDELNELAGKYGVKVAIHEHAKGSSIFWHPDSVLVALKDRPNFGVCADIGHWVRSGLDPVACLKTLKGNIISLHIKDLDEANNIKANDVVVGTGVIDYPAVFTELKNQNFKGYIFVEREDNWDKNAGDVQAAIQYTENWMKKNNE